MINGQSTLSGFFVSGSLLKDAIAYFGSSFNEGQLILSGIIFYGSGYQDYLSSHARLFGLNFRQDIKNLYINKSDLPLLIPSKNNTPESLFVAVLLRIIMYEARDITALVNGYVWKTLFVKPFRLTELVVEINVPAKYKYVDVEIINASDSLSPNEL